MSEQIIAKEIKHKKAYQYVKNKLSKGAVLSNLILKLISKDSLDITALLPKEIEPEMITEFKYGGVIQSNSAMNSLVKMLSKTSNMDAFILFEDQLAKPDDPYLKKLSTDYSFINDTVYLHVTGKKISEQTIKKLLLEANKYIQIGFVGNSKLITDKDISSKIDLNFLKNLAVGINLIVMSIFDEESYLIARLKK